MAPDPEPVGSLVINDLDVNYGALVALTGVSATVHPGDIVGVIGPNGGGKSTLLKAIAGIVPARRGTVNLSGARLRRKHANIAYVPQSDDVNWDFPLSAHDVVLMGRYRSIGWLRRPTREDRARADAALERVGLADIGQRHISQFSGGQQQRIFLARAIVQQPQIVLLDEPMTGIDVRNRIVLHEMIREFSAAGAIVLMATHDLEEVRQHTDKILCLNRRMVAYGPTATTFIPDNLRAAFGGQVAIFA
jgi:manganese/zinc/iron transport system ATP- binding protein